MGAYNEVIIVECRITGPEDSQPNEFPAASRGHRPSQLGGLICAPDGEHPLSEFPGLAR
jgi:hypothetical protein